MNRNRAYYSRLMELVKERDWACRRSYEALIGAMPEGAAHVHHVWHRNGCASMDREENLVTLSWEVHGRIHGGEERAWRPRLLEYLESGEVEAWREEHREELEEIERMKEEADMRKRQRAMKLRPKWVV